MYWSLYIHQIILCEMNSRKHRIMNSRVQCHSKSAVSSAYLRLTRGNHYGMEPSICPLHMDITGSQYHQVQYSPMAYSILREL